MVGSADRAGRRECPVRLLLRRLHRLLAALSLVLCLGLSVLLPATSTTAATGEPAGGIPSTTGRISLTRGSSAPQRARSAGPAAPTPARVQGPPAPPPPWWPAQTRPPGPPALLGPRCTVPPTPASGCDRSASFTAGPPPRRSLPKRPGRSPGPASLSPWWRAW